MNLLNGTGLLFLSLFLSFSSGWAERPEKVITVGVVLHLTGDLAMQSAAFREGIELAADEINVSNDGFRFELAVEDGQNNPKSSHTAVQKLLNFRGVSALILSSYLDAMASGPLLEKQEIPSVVLWDSSPEIEEVGDYMFAMGPWTPSAGEEAARFSMKRLGAKTAVVVTNPDSWSEAVGRYFKDEFRSLGGIIIEEATVGATETDFRTLISRIRGKNPDIVYSPLVFNLVPFYSQIRQQRLGSTVVTSDIIADEHIVKAPEAFEGIYQTGLLDPNSEVYSRLAAAYKTKFGREVTMPWFVAVGYDAMVVLNKVIKDGATSGSEIKKALYALKNHQGASATIAFNEKGSSPQLEHMYQIRSGQLQLASP